MKNILRTLPLSALLAGGMGACDSSTEVPKVVGIEVVSGADQTGAADAMLERVIVVRVLDARANPVANAEISWRVIEGGGTVVDPPTRTDSLGQASVQWKLGNDVGQQLLLVSAGATTLTIRAISTLQFVQVAAGHRHSCALAGSGAVYCWGANNRGQLGNGNALSTPTPVPVKSAIRFRSITAGWTHTCGISNFQETFCWGDNSVGQLGIGSIGLAYATPIPVALGDVFTAISGGYVHTCGLTQASAIVCWGVNERSQLGGTGSSPVRVAGQYTAVAAGTFHTCALAVGGAASCWGWNSNGEIGNGAAFGVVTATPQAVSGNRNYTQISAGVLHTCALSVDSNVYCWGTNGTGETGQDPFVHRGTPALVENTSGFTSAAIGNSHACGLRAQKAYCWGDVLGTGPSISTKVPVQMSADLSFTSLSVGYDHTCGVANGEIWCWGSNSHGQLGQEATSYSVNPRRVLFPGS